MAQEAGKNRNRKDAPGILKAAFHDFQRSRNAWNANSERRAMAMLSANLSAPERRERQSPPPPPPKGGVCGVGMADTQEQGRAAKAEWVRQTFPTCTAFADEVREAFGDVRMVYAEEAGQKIGRLIADGGA